MPRKLSLQRLIKRAEKAGACRPALEKLSQYSTVEEASQDKEAPGWVLWYCLNVKKGQYKPLEYIILKSPNHASIYAIYIIKGKWEEAEFIISTDRFSSFHYTLFVLKQRWEDVEPFIKQNEFLWKKYCKFFNLEK